MRDTPVLRALTSVALRIALPLMLTLVATQGSAQTLPAFVQGNQSVPNASASIVAVPFAAVQSAGNLNVIVVGWRNSNVDVQSVVDTNGNTYVLAVGPTEEQGVGAQSVYYAANITGSTPNVVSVTFTGPAAWGDVRIAEYSGIDPVAPVEASVAAQGWNELSDSGSLITSSAHSLLVAANFVQSVVTQAGPGFTPRGITAPSTNVLEDRVVTPGTYNATAPVAPGVPWIMQLVAFRAAPTVDGEAPTAPASLAATAVSSDQIDLTWMPSNDNVGVTTYLLERCQDPGCASFILITTNGTSYSDSGLAPSTTYSYRVRAADAANNLSAYSNVATTTTEARPDTEAPTPPSALTAIAVSSTEVTLAWTDSTDDVGVVSYVIERCQGAGCSVFAQIAVSGSGYIDSGLVPATTYTYRVRASDAAGNVSGYSNLATATPPLPPDTEAPSDPGGLTATAASGSAIALAWTGSTDNVGVTSYLIERCQDAGCTAFAQVATATTTAFSDAGLVNATTYRYRLRATDDAGNVSGYSTVAAATTPDTQAPSAPGSFAGTAPTSSQVSLTWAASIDNVGVAGYRVSRDGSLIATVTALSYADSGLTAGTAYQYTVIAVDPAGNTSAPVAASVTTLAASTGPMVLASDDFNRANGGPGPGWTVIDSDPRIVGQHIEESYAGDGWDSIAIYTGRAWPADQYSQVSVLAASPHSGASAVVRAKNDPVIEMYFAYVVGPLGPGAQLVLAKFVSHNYTEFFRGVMPVNAGDVLFLGVKGTTLTMKLNGATVVTQEDGSITAGYPGFDITDYDGQGAPGDGQLDNWSAGSLDDTAAITAPATVHSTAVTATTIDLAWTASTAAAGVAGYTVFRDGTLIGTSVTPSFGDTGLTPSTAYTYTVLGHATGGATSASSAPVVVTTQPPVVVADTEAPSAPGSFAGTASSSSQVSLTWTAATDNVGVTGYRVSRDGNLIATVTTASYVDSGLSANTAYGYTVVAVDAAGNTSASASTSVTTTAESTELVVLASDDFNRADGGPGAGWTVIHSDPQLVGQHVQEPNTHDGNDSIAIYTGRAWPADQFSQVAVLAASLHQGASAVVRARNDTNVEMYFAYVVGPLGPGAQLVLGKFVSHQYTELFRGVVPVIAGDILFIGVKGTTLTVKLNGATVATRTDGSISAGYPGFDITDYDGQGAPGEGQLDNWSAGSLESSATAITAPGNVQSTAVTATTIDLAWTASSAAAGVAGYTVFRNGVSIGTSVTPSFGDAGLTPSTAYTYTVVGHATGGGTSASSAPVVMTTQPPIVVPDTDAPGAPGSFAGTAPTSNQVSLTWAASADNVGVAGYRVSRDDSLIATVTTLFYVDSGLTPSTAYQYTVVAVDLAGNTSAPASTTVTTPAESTDLVVLASDDFNRANGVPGAGWTVIDSDPRIVNQHIEETYAGDGWDSIAIHTGLSWPADQYSQVTVLAASPHSGASAVVRAKNDPVIEMYFAYVVGPLGPGAQLVLGKFVSHNYTELFRGVVPVTAGDVLFLGVKGTTLTMKLNGATVTTQEDGSIVAGYPGFDITDYDGQGAPGQGQLDNWSAGRLGGATP